MVANLRESGWTTEMASLQNSERTKDELLTDDKIRALSRSGKTIAAIRMYRLMYGVGLAEGRDGVARLLKSE